MKENVRLSRYTTIGTGGPARWLAEPETTEELVEALAWARDKELPVAAVGLGSNLLVADEGFAGVALKLDGRADGREDRRRGSDGGRRSRERGLPPPRAGGEPGRARVSLRDPGKRGRRCLDERRRVRERHCGRAQPRARRGRARSPLADPAGARPHVPAFRPPARPGRRGRGFRLESRPEAEIKDIVAGMQEKRKAAQPTNKRTFGSVFKNPDHELSAGRMLEACGLRGYSIGGARISPKHANFIENDGRARSVDAIALIVEARRRAFAEYGVTLVPEVQLVGSLESPPSRGSASPGRSAGARGEVAMVARRLALAAARAQPIRPALGLPRLHFPLGRTLVGVGVVVGSSPSGIWRRARRHFSPSSRLL